MQTTVDMPRAGGRLEVRDLTVGYGRDRPVIRTFSFDLPEGESLAIVGESGCGKSTLLTTLAGLRAPVSGQVSWAEGNITDLKTSFVWQSLALFPWKRVRENLELPLLLEGRNRYDAAERELLVAEMLEELGLTGLEKRFPSELSGGQRQRLALGRALIAKPEILFMDEPFSALDALLRERLQDVLMSLRRKHPVRLLFVTHDIAEAVFLADRILVLGARPSRILACLENPAHTLADEPGLRDRAVNFDMIRTVHRTLREAASDTAADGASVSRGGTGLNDLDPVTADDLLKKEEGAC